MPVISADMCPKAFLWDFDGTLANSEDIWVDGQIKIATEYGLEWSRELGYQQSGYPVMDCAQKMANAARSVGPPAEFISQAMADYVVSSLQQHPFPYQPGVSQLINQIRDAQIPCALVSSSYLRILEAGMTQLPDGLFQAVVPGDCGVKLKPAPDPYLKAAQLLGVTPEDCVVFEDSPSGAQSAASSGAVTIVCPNVNAVTADDRWVLVDSLEQLSLADVCQIWRHRRATSHPRNQGTN